VQQAGGRLHHLLRSRDEGEGSEAAAVVRLTQADWLLAGGRVLTFDARRPVADAVALAGGRVLAVGRARELAALAGPRTARVDCRGATVLPGLIDPHLHLYGLATRSAHVDCAGAASVGAVLALVRRAARAQPPGTWIRGEGLDEGRLGRLPTPAELDRAAPRHPVRLRHRSRHASVLSGTALRRLGGAAAAASGLVAGRERAIGRLVGPLPPAVLADGLAHAGRELAALGLTTVADATPRGVRALAPLRAAIAGGRFPLRVVAMRARPGWWTPRARLAPGPVKLLVEETERGLEPSAAVLARRIAGAAAAGAQVAIHCVGAATLAAAVAGLAALPARHRRGRRHRLEHVAECPPPFVPALAALDVVVVTNPAFVHWRGDAYRRETSGEAQRWLYRAASLARAGVALAGASDAPVAPPSPWRAIATARTRRTARGAVLGGGERLSAAAALALFTTGAAYALHGDRFARLVPGAPADVIVVEPDPLSAPASEVAATRVRLTLVGGLRAWPP
jgi:predicted amidohydrolase YtcJ